MGLVTATTKLTFLPLMEDWRPGMIAAFFLRVRVHLAARLVNTFLGHLELTGKEKSRVVSFSSCNS
jgi:hypothetical protein